MRDDVMAASERGGGDHEILNGGQSVASCREGRVDAGEDARVGTAATKVLESINDPREVRSSVLARRSRMPAWMSQGS
jgi:hypothetical protein